MKPGNPLVATAERGFAIVTAIFLIVILAALAAFSVSVFRVQQAGASLDLMGARAFQAAQAGIDWGAWQVNGGTCAAITPLAGLPGVLGEFTVTVTCVIQGPYTEGGPPTRSVFTLTATACNQPAGGGICPNPTPLDGYVERQIRGMVEL